jgi:hypothetical protein
VVETIGVPLKRYAYADKSIGGDTALVGWSITSGGYVSSPGLGRQGGHEPILTATIPSAINAKIRLTKLEMWAFTWKLAQHHFNIEPGVRHQRFHLGTSVLITTAGKTKAQPTLPYTSDPTRLKPDHRG